MRKVVLSATLFMFACTLFLMPANLYSAPIGTFTIVGTGNVRVGSSFIDWGTAPGPVFESNTYPNCVIGANTGACVIDGTTDGTVFVTDATGSFVPAAGTTGVLLDLEDDFAPAGAVFSLPNFLQLSALPTMVFTATNLPLGAGTPAGCTSNPGDVCTPYVGSPFTITNLTSTRAAVALSITGTVTDATGTSTFIGAFSTQFNGLSAADILAAIQRDGWVQSSHSGDFTVTGTIVPEPSSAILFGAGIVLLLAGIAGRRHRAV